MTGALPPGTVTFVFTDIGGSTKLLQELGDDYARPARDHRAIVRTHALGNAMLPLITLVALSAGSIVAGAIVAEDVFSYPGIGLATVDAIDPPRLSGPAGDLPAPDAVGDPLQPRRRAAGVQPRPEAPA